MKKFFKLGKRMLALFIVVLLNINSYAAIGANDGSAFVTKAEFDALVNTFNNQMDTYQAGLNSKIDGAIANYLAGLSSVSSIELDSYITNIFEEDRTFLNNAAIKMNATGAGYKMALGCEGIISKMNGTDNVGYVRTNSYAYNWASLRYAENDDADDQFKVYLDSFDIGGATRYYPSKIADKGMGRMKHTISGEYSSVGATTFSSTIALPSTTRWNIDSTVRIPGENSCTGGKILGEDVSFTVNHSIEYLNEVDMPVYLKYLPACKFKDETNITHKGIIYSSRFDLDSDSQITVASIKGTNGGSRAYSYSTNRDIATRATDTYAYKFYNPKFYSSSPFGYINYSATMIYGAPVYRGQGIPLIKVKGECNLEIPLHLENSNGRCTVSIRKKAFDTDTPGTSKTTDDLYWNDNVATGDLDKITIEQKDSGEVVYWLKVLPNNENATSTVSLYDSIRKVTN